MRLGRTLNTIGTEGDGNGLTINTGSAGGDVANYSPETSTITLDPGRINGSQGISWGAALTHEETHRDQNTDGRYQQAADKFLREGAPHLPKFHIYISQKQTK